HDQSIEPVAFPGPRNASDDRELPRTHPVEPINLLPSGRYRLVPSVLEQVSHTRANIEVREDALDRVRLRVLDALAEHLRPARHEHVVRVLALARPRSPLALLTPQTARQLVAESPPRLIP